ncbi:hypothetical protein DSO57_1037173 [Entomophthora muscae]|nr:hypothetical protein DSO57_1037173 [Entomophthora muscae]
MGLFEIRNQIAQRASTLLCCPKQAVLQLLPKKLGGQEQFSLPLFKFLNLVRTPLKEQAYAQNRSSSEKDFLDTFIKDFGSLDGLIDMIRAENPFLNFYLKRHSLIQNILRSTKLVEILQYPVANKPSVGNFVIEIPLERFENNQLLEFRALAVANFIKSVQAHIAGSESNIKLIVATATDYCSNSSSLLHKLGLGTLPHFMNKDDPILSRVACLLEKFKNSRSIEHPELLDLTSTLYLAKVLRHLIDSGPIEALVFVAPSHTSLHFKYLFEVIGHLEGDWNPLIAEFGGEIPVPGWSKALKLIECGPVSEPRSQVHFPISDFFNGTVQSPESEQEKGAPGKLAMSSLVVQCLQLKRTKLWAVDFAKFTNAGNEPGIYIQYCHARLCG